MKWKVQFVRVFGKPLMHFRDLVCRVVVQDSVDLLILERLCRVIREGDEFLRLMSLIVLRDHRAVEDVECGEPGGGSVPNVIVGARLEPAGLRRQRDLGPVQRLDL